MKDQIPTNGQKPEYTSIGQIDPTEWENAILVGKVLAIAENTSLFTWVSKHEGEPPIGPVTIILKDA